jgi:aerobic carbon-monoxide dehydrogenase medium subunit
MYPFEYVRAVDVADAKRQAAGADVVYLAGGQTLLGAMKLRLASPAKLVDLAAIATLRGIDKTKDGIRIGALTTHAAVATDATVRAAIPALADLAGHIGDRQVRNRGTLGGSLANNDPAACYPAAVLGLNATVHTDRRTIAADDFFLGMFETGLEPGELITAVSFPIPDASAYVKFKQSASRFALVGVFVARSGRAVRVAVTGAGRGVFRCAPLEQALSRDFSPAGARSVHVRADDLNSDLHASADFRAHLISVLTARAVARAG